MNNKSLRRRDCHDITKSPSSCDNSRQSKGEETCESPLFDNNRKKWGIRHHRKPSHQQNIFHELSNTSARVVSPLSRESTNSITSNTLKLLEAVQALNAAKRRRKVGSNVESSSSAETSTMSHRRSLSDESKDGSLKEGADSTKDQHHLRKKDKLGDSADECDEVNAEETMESILMDRILIPSSPSKIKPPKNTRACHLNDISNEMKPNSIGENSEYCLVGLTELPSVHLKSALNKDDRVVEESARHIALSELKQRRLNRQAKEKKSTQSEVVVKNSGLTVSNHKRMNDKLLEMQKTFISSFNVCGNSDNSIQPEEKTKECSSSNIPDYDEASNVGLENSLMSLNLNPVESAHQLGMESYVTTLIHERRLKSDEDQPQLVSSTESFSSSSLDESLSITHKHKLSPSKAFKMIKKASFIPPVSPVKFTVTQSVNEFPQSDLCYTHEANEITFLPEPGDDESIVEADNNRHGRDHPFYPSFKVIEDNILADVVEEINEDDEEFANHYLSLVDVYSSPSKNSEIIFIPSVVTSLCKEEDSSSSQMIDSVSSMDSKNNKTRAVVIRESERRKRILSS